MELQTRSTQARPGLQVFQDRLGAAMGAGLAHRAQQQTEHPSGGTSRMCIKSAASPREICAIRYQICSVCQIHEEANGVPVSLQASGMYFFNIPTRACVSALAWCLRHVFQCACLDEVWVFNGTLHGEESLSLRLQKSGQGPDQFAWAAPIPLVHRGSNVPAARVIFPLPTWRWSICE